MLLHYVVLSIDHMIILDGLKLDNLKSDDGLGVDAMVYMTTK